MNATCTCVGPGAKGPETTTLRPATLPCGDEPCMMEAPWAPSGNSSVNTLAGSNRRGRGVHDLQDVEAGQRLVAHLEYETRLASKDDRSRLRGSARGRRRSRNRAGRPRGSGDQHHPDAAGSRHVELLRLKPLAVDDG